MMKRPTNIVELRDALTEVFTDLVNSTIKPAAAKEANNSAGKIVATVKVQLEYSQQRKEPPEIEFLAERGARSAIDKARSK